MKTVILNGSPRKNWNTAQILKEAQRGAESAGDEVSYVDLYSLDYNGCHGCMACKRKGIAEPFKCRFKDGLTPVLESILQADRLIAGAPIYFDNVPGGFRSFVERISFPALSYNDYTSTFPGKVDIDMFFTMNEKRWEQLAKPSSPRRSSTHSRRAHAPTARSGRLTYAPSSPPQQQSTFFNQQKRAAYTKNPSSERQPTTQTPTTGSRLLGMVLGEYMVGRLSRCPIVTRPA